MAATMATLCEMDLEMLETVSPFLSAPSRRKLHKAQAIITLLKEDSRMQLTEMAKRTKWPIATIYEYIKEIRRHYNFTIEYAPNKDQCPKFRANKQNKQMQEEPATEE